MRTTGTQEKSANTVSPDHEPLKTLNTDTTAAPAPTNISLYRDSLIGPSDARKKRRLEANLKRWGVSDPDLCRTLAVKVQEYQFQDLQEFIEASDRGSGDLGDRDQEGSQVYVENLLALANFSQSTPPDFFEWAM
ncbi:hypothetical protein F53441_5380 [Fusarium austroafricanum]|uniref:Uncharacterized protein n=1 Tax=Fusarium austroafricanum TaxID=2364996 RepID=A0A8H4KK18_9HYPO|nr:hypothetical protein F53441_5380 [Fusarium austroafricanum]